MEHEASYVSKGIVGGVQGLAQRLTMRWEAQARACHEEAFRATATTHLRSCDVESNEADVGGLSPWYTQKYQNARVGEGDPFGEGSFRCSLTKATPRARGGRRLK